MSLAKPKWYRTNIGTGALLLFFFPVGLYLLWSNPEWSKKSKWIATAITAVMIMIAVSSPKSGTTTEQAVSSPAPVASETTAATATPTPQPQTMNDKLMSATKTAMGKNEGYSVAYDETTKTATLTAEPREAWDDSAYVRSGYTALVKFGTEAFKIDGVDNVSVEAKVAGTDGYGKDFVDTGIILTMPKTEFVKYDWKKLEFQPIYRQMITSCSKYYIAPFILKNIDMTKLYLSLS